MHDREAVTSYALLASQAEAWRGSLAVEPEVGPVSAWHLNYAAESVEGLVKALVQLDRIRGGSEASREALLRLLDRDVLPALLTLVERVDPQRFGYADLSSDRIGQLAGVVKALWANVDVLGPEASREEPGVVSLAELRESLT